MLKDETLRNGLARVMVIGVILAGSVILVGLAWFLCMHPGISPGDHIFKGEPKYFENPIGMVKRAFAPEEDGHIRSLIMIGIVILLLNPLVRVAFSLLGYAVQRDRLYTVISALVFIVLLISFFW